jgi:Tfp pilus assembly protein PilO
VNRRPIIIGAVAFVLFLLLWYFLGFAPQQKKIHDAQKRRATAEQKQQELQTAINRLKAAQKNEPLQRAQLETLKTAIPDDPALGQFILDVNDRATASGIDFVSIAPALPTAGAVAAATPGATGVAAPAPAQISVSLQITGGYFQVIDFINRLADLPRILVLDTLNVASDNGGHLTVGIASRMFVRQVPAGFAAPGSAAAAATTTTTAAGASGSTTTTVAGAGGATTTTTTAGAKP